MATNIYQDPICVSDTWELKKILTTTPLMCSKHKIPELSSCIQDCKVKYQMHDGGYTIPL